MGCALVPTCHRSEARPGRHRAEQIPQALAHHEANGCRNGQLKVDPSALKCHRHLGGGRRHLLG